MWVAGTRLLGTLASEEGEISDKARDELMTCNAHKIVIKAMNPVCLRMIQHVFIEYALELRAFFCWIVS